LAVKIEALSPLSYIYMPYLNYSPDTQIHWSKLEPGTAYLHYSTCGVGKFNRFVFKGLLSYPETNSTFVLGENGREAYAVGDWIEVPGGPGNRFWTADTPVPDMTEKQPEMEGVVATSGRRRSSSSY